MNRCKKIISSLLIMTMVFSMILGTTAFAKENKDTITVEADTDAVETLANSTIVGPDGYTYTYVGRATHSYPLEGSLSKNVTASQNVHIAFYVPNNNRKDLVQGTVIGVPTMGGSQQSFTFTNYYDEVSIIDLSKLPSTMIYRISFTIYAIGTSNTAEVYYRIY